MTVLIDLYRIFEERGFSISSGLNPNHFLNRKDVPFTIHYLDGKQVTGGLGLALQEIYFLECLHERHRSKRVFIIGNAMGWSTFALALLNPGSHVVAIDAGIDRNSKEGIEFTNRTAAELDLDVKAVLATSPRDVAQVVESNFDDELDLVLIDGFHTNKQVVADFEAVRPYLGNQCIVLFHDVIAFRMLPGLRHIASRSRLKFVVLCATPSGMAMLYAPELEPAIGPVARIFGGNYGAIGGLLRERYREVRGKSGDEAFQAMADHMLDSAAMLELFQNASSQDARAFYEEFKKSLKR